MRTIIALLLGIILILPYAASARSLFHATSKAAQKKILQKGFSSRFMKTQARYGKGIYLSGTKKITFKERPRAETVMRFKDSKFLQRNTLNVRRMSKSNLKEFSHDKDLRGNIHRGVLGGDLAKKMGRQAGKQGKIIAYPSAKGNGTNIFIPKKVYESHPRILRPVKRVH